MNDISAPMTEQDALVTLMIAVSVSDASIKTIELMKIERIVTYLPIFRNYDLDRLNEPHKQFLNYLKRKMESMLCLD